MVHLLSSFDINSILIAGIFGGFFHPLFHAFSINPKGTPLSRGDVPAAPKALPPAAQLPNMPSQSVRGRRAGRRRHGNGTMLTGPRGLQSTQAGKTILGA